MPLLRAACLSSIIVAAYGCGGSTPTQATAIATQTIPSASSCPGTTSARGTMSAQINGTPWTATCITAASWPGNILSLGATDGSQTIGLGATASAPGTYSMTTGAANATLNLLPATNPAAWWANLAAAGSSGTLTLTKLDTTGSAGTFTFTAVPLAGTGSSGNKVVTSGTFNVTF